MSNLISNRWVASWVTQTPSPARSAVATSPPDLDMTSVSPVLPFGPTVSPAPMSSTSSVTHPLLSAWQTHRWPYSFEEAEQSREASSIHGEGPRQVMHLSHSIFSLTIWNSGYNCFKVPNWYKVFELLGECVVFVVTLSAGFRKCYSFRAGSAEFSIENRIRLMFTLFIW